jgi:hypothetical protein
MQHLFLELFYRRTHICIPEEKKKQVRQALWLFSLLSDGIFRIMSVSK